MCQDVVERVKGIEPSSSAWKRVWTLCQVNGLAAERFRKGSPVAVITLSGVPTLLALGGGPDGWIVAAVISASHSLSQ